MWVTSYTCGRSAVYDELSGPGSSYYKYMQDLLHQMKPWGDYLFIYKLKFNMQYNQLLPTIIACYFNRFTINRKALAHDFTAKRSSLTASRTKCWVLAASKYL